MKDLWQKLQDETRPVVLYGMGNGAQAVLKQLDKIGVKPAGIFASDTFVRGQTFCGYTVERYDTLASCFSDMVILVCFGSNRREVLDYIDALSQKHTVYCPDVPVCGDSLFDFDFAQKHSEQLRSVYELLSDEPSKKVFENIVRFKLSGEMRYLRQIENSDGLFSPVLPLRNESFVDLGAYRGDTIEEFLSLSNEYAFICGVEPNIKTYNKLYRAFEDYPKMRLVHAAISDIDGTVSLASDGRGTTVSGSGKTVSAISLDTLLTDVDNVSLIKMDVEGHEHAAICGGKDLILKHKPKMIVAGYHRSEDLFDLPLLVHSIRQDYRILLRHSVHNLAWDTNFYFI